jgi:hypothetical protein
MPSIHIEGRGAAPARSPKLTLENLARLLHAHGDLYSARLGIALNGLDAGELFRWFLASMLLGARITESVAGRTYEAFLAHGLATPQGIVAANFGELLLVMAEGGYVRYDNMTSRKVQAASAKLLHDYGGDLNRLHAAATDSRDLEARLIAFNGIGPTTAGIFLRELRGLWPKADPPLGELARLAASHIGIDDPARYWKRRALPGYDYRRFEAALTRLGRDCRRGRCSKSPIPH